MREIKFRVWNKPLGQYINKDYHKKYYLNFEGVLCSFNDFGLVLPLDMKNYIVEMFTGLVDKNGVEIYEGDKIFAKVGEHEYVWKVLQNGDQWTFDSKNGNNEIVKGLYCRFNDNVITVITITQDNKYRSVREFNEDFDIEVIGNIHEVKE